MVIALSLLFSAHDVYAMYMRRRVVEKGGTTPAIRQSRKRNNSLKDVTTEMTDVVYISATTLYQEPVGAE